MAEPSARALERARAWLQRFMRDGGPPPHPHDVAALVALLDDVGRERLEEAAEACRDRARKMRQRITGERKPPAPQGMFSFGDIADWVEGDADTVLSLLPPPTPPPGGSHG